MIRRNEWVTIICGLSTDHVFHNLFYPSNRRVYAMLCWYGNYITQIRTNEKQQVSYELNHEWWVERIRAWSAMGNNWCLHIFLFTQSLGQNKSLWVNSFALAKNKTIFPFLMCVPIPVPHHFQICQTSNPLCKSITVLQVQSNLN